MKRHLWAVKAVTLIACICLPLSASGQTLVPTAGPNTTTNYLQNFVQPGPNPTNDGTELESGFNLPGPNSGNTIINGSRTLFVDSVINTAANTLLINNTSGGGGTADLEIRAGGSLGLNSVLVSAGDDAGTLAVQGGTLNVGGGGVEARANGTVDITSGTLNSTGIIDIQSGSSFSVSGGNLNVDVTSGAAINLDGGNLDISGGIVTLTDFAPGGEVFDVTAAGNTGAIHVSGGVFQLDGLTAGSDTVSFGNEVINISGGEFEVIGGQVFAGNDTQFNIIGDAATIQWDRLNLATATRQSTFNFVFDSDGVSTVENAAFLTLTVGNLLVDGSAFTGDSGSFDLFTSGNLTAGFDLDNVTVTGFDDGLDFELVQTLSADGGNGNVTLNVFAAAAVPEPSSLAILGCVAAVGMIRRRRSV